MDADQLYVSAASLWEIAIKIKISKLEIEYSIMEISEQCKEQSITILPIKIEHIGRTVDMPLKEDHRDPFDRLIIATAEVENLVLISSDEKTEISCAGSRVHTVPSTSP